MLSLAHRVGCGLTPAISCGGFSHVTLGMHGWEYLMLGAQPNDSQLRPRRLHCLVRRRRQLTLYNGIRYITSGPQRPLIS